SSQGSGPSHSSSIMTHSQAKARGLVNRDYITAHSRAKTWGPFTSVIAPYSSQGSGSRYSSCIMTHSRPEARGPAIRGYIMTCSRAKPWGPVTQPDSSDTDTAIAAY
ncbi:hypothetical protein HAX54_028747, partial [Datura stramonium]|nr:hypothetical protein [Datura stramonium]